MGRFKRLRAFLAVAVVGAGLVLVNPSASAQIVQTGPDNYAGPLACPQAGFEFCTNDTSDVVQISNGGQNVFVANGDVAKVNQDNSTGPNSATCNDTTTAEQSVQSCDVKQDGDGGNTVTGTMSASPPQSSAQSVDMAAAQTIKVEQDSDFGDNSVTIADMRIEQHADTRLLDLGLPVIHSQETKTLSDINQETNSGDNYADVTSTRIQSSFADGASPNQRQDADVIGGPNATMRFFQRAYTTGTNETKGRGLDSKTAEAHIRAQLGTPIEQIQWSEGQGIHATADVDSAVDENSTVDFGTPPPAGADCEDYDGFRKLGVIDTFEGLVFESASTTGLQVQDDKLIPDILGTSPNTGTVAACSKLDGGTDTQQTADVSHEGHSKDNITGTIAATLIRGNVVAASARTDFSGQTTDESVFCTNDGCTTTQGGVTGSGIDVSATAGQEFTGPVAEFTNADPDNQVTAKINWGDGSDPSDGVITGAGPYTVNGTHEYAYGGTYDITTTFYNADNSEAGFVTSTATVANPQFGYVPGGSFVVGDRAGQFQNALQNGSLVTFWSQSWNVQNPLSSGKSAPSQFKGWQNSLTNNPQGTGNLKCGQPVPQWSSTGGNSPPPPTGTLPEYMAVIVASNVSKAGQTPTGNVKAIVIVNTTGTTYSPNPSADGKGVVSGVICTS